MTDPTPALDTRTALVCPSCGAGWRSGTPPAAMFCESVQLDRVVAWFCVACSSWWRLSLPTLDAYTTEELARLADLDPAKCRGTCI